MNINYREIFQAYSQPKVVLQIKGTNGSGKTSLVKQVVLNNNSPIYITDDSGYIIGTLNEKTGFVAIGNYETDKKMGGCDRLKGKVTTVVKTLLSTFWLTPYNIIYEGVIVSDIKTTFFEYCQQLSGQLYGKFSRLPLYGFLDTTLEECFKRIYSRNQGKQIKENLVSNKYNNISNHRLYYTQNKGTIFTIKSAGCTVEESAEQVINHVVTIQKTLSETWK